MSNCDKISTHFILVFQLTPKELINAELIFAELIFAELIFAELIFADNLPIFAFLKAETTIL